MISNGQVRSTYCRDSGSDDVIEALDRTARNVRRINCKTQQNKPGTRKKCCSSSTVRRRKNTLPEKQLSNQGPRTFRVAHFEKLQYPRMLRTTTINYFAVSPAVAMLLTLCECGNRATRLFACTVARPWRKPGGPWCLRDAPSEESRRAPGKYDLCETGLPQGASPWKNKHNRHFSMRNTTDFEIVPVIYETIRGQCTQFNALEVSSNGNQPKHHQNDDFLVHADCRNNCEQRLNIENISKDC